MEIQHLLYEFQSGRELQYVSFDMLNKYFIAKIAENTFFVLLKSQNRNIGLPGEIEKKVSRLFFVVVVVFFCFFFLLLLLLFFKPTPIFSDAEMKVVGNGIVRFFKICL